MIVEDRNIQLHPSGVMNMIGSGIISTVLPEQCQFSGSWRNFGTMLGAYSPEIMYFGTTMTQQQAANIGQLLSYKPALDFLVELYEKVRIEPSSLSQRDTEKTSIAIGMLTATNLCEVSPLSIRLTSEGKKFVEILSETQNTQ